MKKINVILLIGLSVNALASPGPRQRLLMDIGWKFSLTDTMGAEKPEFIDSKWRTLNLPHDWSIEGEVIQVMAYTNCDTVELFVNGKSFGMKAIDFPRQGNSGGWNRYDKPLINNSTSDLHLVWDVPYAPGTLKAVGRKGGKIVCEETVKTTGPPAGIILTTDSSFLHINSTEVAHIKVEIVDDNGNRVPDANNSVKLSVEKAGTLIGYDNGNPRDHTSMKSPERSTFNGLALAVIQPTSEPGAIIINATSPGIRSGTIAILQIPKKNK